MLLGDVATENEAWEDAVADYDAALEHHAAAAAGEADRRVAEVHFKRACVLQFMDKIEEALGAVGAAVATLEGAKAALAGKEDEDSHRQVADVEAVLEELKDKVEELEGAAQEAAATRTAVRGAMEQLGAAMAAAAGGSGGGGPSGEVGNLGTASVGASPVKDLGVVGRGTKRINLAPVSAPSGAAPAEEAQEGAAPVPKKKRSLEDLRGGAAGDSATVGFGAEPAAANGSAPAVPAFLAALAKKPEAGGQA